MKLIDRLKTFAAHLKNVKITRNDYRWFFIPTIQYGRFNVGIYTDEEVFQGNFRDTNVKAHFLNYTLTLFTKRTPV